MENSSTTTATNNTDMKVDVYNNNTETSQTTTTTTTTIYRQGSVSPQLIHPRLFTILKGWRAIYSVFFFF